jgi:hypothetical protein
MNTSKLFSPARLSDRLPSSTAACETSSTPVPTFEGCNNLSDNISAETKFCARNTWAGLTPPCLCNGLLISSEFSSERRFGIEDAGESIPMKRILPLNLRESFCPPRGSLPNHSSSSVREDVIEWSVNSPNLRFRGVFQKPLERDGDCVGIGGVGTRGRGIAMMGSGAIGAEYD